MSNRKQPVPLHRHLGFSGQSPPAAAGGAGPQGMLARKLDVVCQRTRESGIKEVIIVSGSWYWDIENPSPKCSSRTTVRRWTIVRLEQ
ncbi:MAG TPA: hypothetical protein EYP49_08325 [Anaerolineae bacterium]|nr:hypothetical protein [Anaerolineae bacterium]